MRLRAASSCSAFAGSAASAQPAPAWCLEVPPRLRVETRQQYRNDTDRIRNFTDMPCGMGPTGDWIDEKGDQRPTALIGGKKQITSGAETKVPGRAAQRTLVAHHLRPAAPNIYVHHSQTVIAPQGSVEMAAVGVNMDVSTGVSFARRPICRKQRHCLLMRKWFAEVRAPKM